jgi:hypothetical protein
VLRQDTCPFSGTYDIIVPLTGVERGSNDTIPNDVTSTLAVSWALGLLHGSSDGNVRSLRERLARPP